MLSFLCLPRELRDLIYDECFVAVKPIDLQNLAPSLERPVSRRLCLTPNFLASCRQVYEEGMTKLYGENLYFVDLTSSWRFARSVQWRKCFGLRAEQLDICIVCQRTRVHGLAPNAKPTLDGWNPNLGRVRRLQVSLQEYTYSQWKYRQPSAFPRILQDCLHVPCVVLQRQLHLDLLVVRILERSLLSIEDSRLPSSWYTVSQAYNIRDVEQWKVEGDEDLKRLVDDVLRFAAHRARNVIISKNGLLPQVSTKDAVTPRYVFHFLKTGRYFGREALSPGMGSSDGGSFEVSCRARQKIYTLAKMSGSRIVRLDGENIAFMSIYGSLLSNR
jgi:hypothetical protein